VERGVGTGTRIEADALIMTAGMSHREITERILRRADPGAALVDATDGTVTRWPRFAQVVRAAAHGLGRRGVTDGDTVGVLVCDAVSHVIAVHAIRAAGATALGLTEAGGAAGIAAALGRARVVITAAPLARLATQAADRSWVRQVFAFGDAEGTTPFGSLLEGAPPDAALSDGAPFDGTPSGAAPGFRPARPPEPAEELAFAGGPDLAPGDVVVAAPPCGRGQAYTSLLDLVLLAGATVVAAPVPQVPAALRRYRGTAAIVPAGTGVPGLPAGRVIAVP
jgi:hypothetical protein